MPYDRRVLDFPYRHYYLTSLLSGLIFSASRESLNIHSKLSEGDQLNFDFNGLHSSIEIINPSGSTDTNPLIWEGTALTFFDGFFGAWFLLNFIRRFKVPRVKNSYRGFIYAVKANAGRFTNKGKLERKNSEKFYELYEFDGKEFDDARKKVSDGKFGEALDLYLEYLDSHEKQYYSLYDRLFSNPFTWPVEYLSIYLNKTTPNLVRTAFSLFFDKKDYIVFNKIFPKIFEQEPNNLELKILYSTLLSLRNHPRALKAWKEIIDTSTLLPFGESRNLVLELSDNQYVKDAVIIKKGQDLKKESQILQALNKTLPYDSHLVPKQLAFFDNDEQILITRRRKATTLEDHLYSEDLESDTETAIKSLAQFHSIDLHSDIGIYSPLREIERRFVNRFPNKTAEEFMKAYREFYNKFVIHKLVLSHCDFYPSNILVDGTIIDLEKTSFASPWLDIETLLGAPEISSLDTNNLLNHYRKILPLPSVGRELFALHTSICQTGSFHAKKSPIREHYIRRTIKLAEEMSEHEIKQAYLQILGQ